MGNINVVDTTLTATTPSPLYLDYTQVVSTHTHTVQDVLTANAAIDSTSTNVGALLVPNGGMGVAGNVYVASRPGSRFQVGSGGTLLSDVIAQFTGNVNAHLDINLQNLSQGNKASTNLVATADIGNVSQNYVNLGITNSTFADPAYPYFAPIDSYLVADGGNLLVVAERAGKTITFMQGGYTAANVVGTWGATQLTVNTNLSVAGNVTVSGSLGITTTVIKTTPVVYASLPNAVTVGAGARAFITDANTATFGSAVQGGGGLYVPVYSNGVRWWVG